MRQQEDPSRFRIAILPDAVPTGPGFRVLFFEYNKFLFAWTADRLGI